MMTTSAYPNASRMSDRPFRDVAGHLGLRLRKGHGIAILDARQRHLVNHRGVSMASKKVKPRTGGTPPARVKPTTVELKHLQIAHVVAGLEETFFGVRLKYGPDGKIALTKAHLAVATDPALGKLHQAAWNARMKFLAALEHKCGVQWIGG
jgi:hypothetical protein